MPIVPHPAHSKTIRLRSSPTAAVRTILMGSWQCWQEMAMGSMASMRTNLPRWQWFPLHQERSSGLR
jgi:hypothetical protein